MTPHYHHQKSSYSCNLLTVILLTVYMIRRVRVIMSRHIPFSLSPGNHSCNLFDCFIPSCILRVGIKSKVRDRRHKCHSTIYTLILIRSPPAGLCVDRFLTVDKTGGNVKFSRGRCCLT